MRLQKEACDVGPASRTAAPSVAAGVQRPAGRDPGQIPPQPAIGPSPARTWRVAGAAAATEPGRMQPVLTLLTALLCAAGPLSAAPAPQGGWQWPLGGPLGGPLAGPPAGTPTVARGFDPPAARWLPGHRGVDLRASPGAAVLAAGPGVVAFAGTIGGTGVVALRHVNGLE